jgi:hypothetical protein
LYFLIVFGIWFILVTLRIGEGNKKEFDLLSPTALNLTKDKDRKCIDRESNPELGQYLWEDPMLPLHHQCR